MRRILVRTLLVMVASTVLGGQPIQAQLTKQLPESKKPTLLAKPNPPWTSPPTSKLISGPLFEPDVTLKYLSGPQYAWSIPTSTKPILNLTKFPEERLIVASLKGYPNLGSDFEVVAPRTGHVDHPKSQVPGVKQYNCIAWSLGITDHWVWPGKTVREFDDLYTKYGFKRAETRNLKLEAGVVKVALYGKLNDAGELAATHAARQESDGTWTSKLGGEARIRHLTPDAVAGPVYGDPIAVYTRKR